MDEPEICTCGHRFLDHREFKWLRNNGCYECGCELTMYEAAERVGGTVYVFKP